MSEAAPLSTPNATLPEALVAAVQAVVPAGREIYPLHEPRFEPADWEAVKDCLDSGWVSSVGRYVDRLEAMLGEITGAAHVIATVNGTTALHLAYLTAGVARDDEVIVPALTFVATANAAAHCGAVPHFADCEESTLGLDPRKLATHLSAVAERRNDGVVNRNTGRRIAAVAATHVFGHPADLDGLAAVCADWGLPLLEDAAEALGSHYRGRHVGTGGRLATLSFNGNKLITTGGGGAVLTSDPELAERARHLSTTAKQAHPWRYDHDAVAFNYRLPNLNAALGCSQLERLPELLARKRALADRYHDVVSKVAGLKTVIEPAGCRSNYWLNAALLNSGDIALRDAALEALHGAGLLARPAWTLLHRLPMFEMAPRMDLSVASALEQRLICLPSSPDLA